jgi:protein O-mannosyl-transferase
MAKRSKQKKTSLGTIPSMPVMVADFLDHASILNGKLVLRALIIMAAVFWIYWPALHGDWLWDDELLITHNSLVHDPAGWWEIWLEPFHLVDYFPVTVSVEWAEWHLWGDHPFAFHVTTVLLHGINALLVWRLFGKLGLRLAWLEGLLFAVHPVLVESVAWIAELKNTLSLLPFLLAMCAWIDFSKNGQRKNYLLALFFLSRPCFAKLPW